MPLDRKKKADARAFGQDLMRGEHVVGKHKAIAGGGTGKNSAFMFRTEHGYEASEQAQETGNGTSIFDPVLTELAYRWFSPPDAVILDPFAGGSVRGIVAAVLGRHYTGIDLRAEQVEANRAQAEQIVPGNLPTWFCGDSADMLPGLAVSADFIFSCPPYGDLEVYSDDPADLSTMTRKAFLAVYRDIIAKACAKLKSDRFACFVVGDYRDQSGAYCNFVSETIRAFLEAGLVLYNEAILVTAVGSLPVRAGKQFTAGRKLGKTHQNVLVFLKGDAKKATLACGPVEFGEIDEYQETTA